MRPVPAAGVGARLGALLQEPLQRLAAAERGGPCTGADAHAVLRDAVQIDQTSFAQHLHGMLEQLPQELGAVGAEIGEGMVVDGDPTGEPAEGVVTDAQVGQLPGAGEAGEGGIQPQGDEQTRVDGRSSGNAAACPNGVKQECEVQPLDVRPNSASGVVGFEEFIDGDGRKELLAIRDRQTRSGGAVGHGKRQTRGVGHGGANSRGFGLSRGASLFDSRRDLHGASLGVLPWSHRLSFSFFLGLSCSLYATDFFTGSDRRRKFSPTSDSETSGVGAR